jgi:hypothetical protein
MKGRVTGKASMSESQRGYLRKRNLPNPPTLADNFRAEIEYAHSTSLFLPAATNGPFFEIVNVKIIDEKMMDDGEYVFHAIEEGLFPCGADITLIKEHGQWRRIT